MNDKQVDQAGARNRLQKLIDDLTAIESTSREGAGVVTLDQTSVGRVSRVDALQAQAMGQETERRRQDALRRAQRALRKLESGDYGYCENCDEPIAPARLAVDPAAEFCIRCADNQEQADSVP